MKLSEAIRLSTTIVPSIHAPDKIFQRDWRGNVCGACRAGAVALAAGYKPTRQFVAWHGEIDEALAVMRLIDRCWPWWMRAVQTQQVPFMMYLGAATYIAHAHEVRKLTADQLAAEIEKLEAKYDHDPVTMNVTPNVAGDATQLQEVQ